MKRRGENGMWDLNDSPDHGGTDEFDGHSSPKTSIEGDDDRAKWVASISNSSSSAVVMEDGSDADEASAGEGEPLVHRNDFPPATRQFFPLEDSNVGAASSVGGGGSAVFPRARWVGVKFCQTEPLAAVKPVAILHPIKKSRRGPRSRSSQYRGVTFYRRTGRWESHIWLASY